MRISIVGIFLCSFLIVGCAPKKDMTDLEHVVNGNSPTFEGTPVSPEARAQIEALLEAYKKEAEGRIEQREELGLLYKSVGMTLASGLAAPPCTTKFGVANFKNNSVILGQTHCGLCRLGASALRLLPLDMVEP